MIWCFHVLTTLFVCPRWILACFALICVATSATAQPSPETEYIALGDFRGPSSSFLRLQVQDILDAKPNISYFQEDSTLRFTNVPNVRLYGQIRRDGQWRVSVFAQSLLDPNFLSQVTFRFRSLREMRSRLPLELEPWLNSTIDAVSSSMMNGVQDDDRRDEGETSAEASDDDEIPGSNSSAEFSRSPEATLSTVISDDSLGISRFVGRAATSMNLPYSLRLTVGGGITSVHTESLQWNYGLLAAALQSTFMEDKLRLEAHIAVYLQNTANESFSLSRIFTGGAVLNAVPHDILQFALGVRRRSFIDLSFPLSTDEELFHTANINGANDPQEAYHLTVTELRLQVLLLPTRGMYVFLDGHAYFVADTNQGYDLSFGAGVDLIEVMELDSPVNVGPLFSSYFVGYEEQQDSYFSPSLLHSHNIGGELGMRWQELLRVSGQAGVSISKTDQRVRGWFVGAAVDVTYKIFKIKLKAEILQNPTYFWRRAWLSLHADW